MNPAGQVALIIEIEEIILVGQPFTLFLPDFETLQVAGQVVPMFMNEFNLIF